MGNSGCFPCGKTSCAYCVFLCFHNPSNSGVDYRIFNVRTDVNACDCTRECTDTRKRVCTESWVWEKKTLAAPGNRTCVSGVTVQCSTNELHSLGKVYMEKIIMPFWQREEWGVRSRCWQWADRDVGVVKNILVHVLTLSSCHRGVRVQPKVKTRTFG